MSVSVRSVTPLIFASGACALVYQVAWFRELRLVFGASTAASAAVLAVFMGGLGVGGLVLGRRINRADHPLTYYGNLEIIVAAAAAATPLLVRLAQSAYYALGGVATLGSFGATLVRLVLTALVLGPATVAMGGTLPAAAKAVSTAGDTGRRHVAWLYGINTMGAVAGSFAANFLLIEVFGDRLTIWMAALLNLLVGVIARGVARRSSPVPAEEVIANVVQHEPPPRWLPPAAAATAGLSFMLMELVWYRMLGPLLGGSSYTFGLILGIALAGIGIGAAIYSGTTRAPTMMTFAATCTALALALAIPLALGDRIALFALSLRPLAMMSFGGAVLAWSFVAIIIVLPAAIVSGYQFPVVIGLYGRGSDDVARDVGRAYLANTLGAIGGAVAGGFGLMRLLGAIGCWRWTIGLLLASGAVTLVVALKRARERSAIGVVLAAVVTVLLARTTGPTAVWRHTGIGVGREDDRLPLVPASLAELVERGRVAWEEDGIESSVALTRRTGFAFVVNGKVDGHIEGDSGTQVMSALMPTLLHPNPKSALVIGLGTGTTAGWLGAVPSMERVDVMELEPAILRVARDCSAVNRAVLDNPRVRIQLGDARESLLTTRDRYDVVISEPSNPYRAGIASLYTVEYYRAVADRLEANGIFGQWIQAYDVDPFAMATTALTLREVFPHVSLWSTQAGDFLFVAQREAAPIDMARVRERMRGEPWLSGAAGAWRTASAEGVLAHFIAGEGLIDLFAQYHLGAVNQDDRNVLEFAFARNVGRHAHLSDDVAELARRVRVDQPRWTGPVDEALLAEERIFQQSDAHLPLDRATRPPLPRLRAMLAASERSDFASELAQWNTLDRAPASLHEAMLVAEAAAHTGDERFPELIELVLSPTEKALLGGIWFARRSREAEAVASLERGFLVARTEPFVRSRVLQHALRVSVDLGVRSADAAGRLMGSLAEPFAGEAARGGRVQAYLLLAEATHDAARCVDAFDRAGPFDPTRQLFEVRALCYRVAHDPRTPEAEAALAQLRSLTPTFGEEIPTPP